MSKRKKKLQVDGPRRRLLVGGKERRERKRE